MPLIDWNCVDRMLFYFSRLFTNRCHNFLRDVRYSSAGFVTLLGIYAPKNLAIYVPQKNQGGLCKQNRQQTDKQALTDESRPIFRRCAPRYLFADNGAKFTGQPLDLWAKHAKVPAMRSIAGRQAEGYHRGVGIDFSRLGTPSTTPSLRWIAPRRVPKHALVRNDRRSSVADRGVAAGLQSRFITPISLCC